MKLIGSKTPTFATGTRAILLLLGAFVCLVPAGCGDDDPVTPRPEPAWTQTLAPQYTHRAVWGVNSSHFFVVGEKSSISRYADGEWTRWQFLYFETLRGVWGADRDRVLAVGLNGRCYRFEDEDWVAEPTPTGADLMGIWGAAWDDAWAVGEDGVILRWDGTAWTAVPSPTTSLLYSVWGPGNGEVFACGRDGVIIRWDGSDWTVYESGTGDALDSIWGFGRDDVYAVGRGDILHWDGSDWTREPSGTNDRLWAVRGLPGRDPVALGANGTFLRREAGVWRAETIAGGVDLYGLWDDGDGALLLVGYNGLVMRLTDPAWQVLNQGFTHWLTGILAADCDRTVAVGKRGTILMSLGAGWVDIAPDIGDVDYAAVWGPSADDFFVVGNGGVIVRFRAGAPWSVWRLQNGANLESVWGTGPDDVYAAGSGGVVVRFDGIGWETMETGTTLSLSAISGRGPSDIYAVGLQGVILHFDGVRWQTRDSGVTTTLKGVCSRADGETVVVGDEGLILHSGPAGSSGTRWNPPARTVTSFNLHAVTGDADGNTYAVGEGGVVLRYDGEDWQPLATGQFDRLNAVDVGPCGGIQTAGNWGLILEYTD
jgi:hypothetical protein